MVARTVQMSLEGLDGNAFNLLGHFRSNARQQGWPPAEIDAVIQEATATNYDHLLETLQSYITEDGTATDA